MARLLRLKDVSQKVGLSVTSIYELRIAGKFPTPTRIGAAVRWSEAELDTWIEQQLATRESRTA